jgi:hypothetical protein
MRAMRGVGLSAGILLSCSTVCAAQNNGLLPSYDAVPVGHLKGKLIVQWLEPDVFLFLPDQEKPLTFTRSNGETIQPGRMLTDGGSIPPALWILRNYSPWGYAPAFIVHDWLFDLKHCKLRGYEHYDHHIAARVMAEVMKTMMVSGKVPVDKPTLISMYLAVNSPIAERLWNDGQCQPPPSRLASRRVVREFELTFP